MRTLDLTKLAGGSRPLALQLPWVVLVTIILGTTRDGQGADPVPAETPALINLARFGILSHFDNAKPPKLSDIGRLAQATKNPVALKPDQAIRLAWAHPRDIQSVTLRFNGPLPPANQLTIEWWRRVWPDNGKGGWMKLDDPFNGQWTTVRFSASTNGPNITYQFAPLDASEAPGIKQQGFPFRRTYKLRLTTRQPVQISHCQAFSTAIEKEARLRFEWGLVSDAPGKLSPRFEMRNGQIQQQQRLGNKAALVEVKYADAPDRLSADRGHLVFRAGESRSFSVFIDDVVREGGLFVRDLGVFVSDYDHHPGYAQWPGPGDTAWPEGTIMEQVSRLPEQSFEGVRKAIPTKPPVHCFLGIPNLRQEIAVTPEGAIVLYADSLRSLGPDSVCRPWTWPDLVYHLNSGSKPISDLKAQPKTKRSLENNWLPVVRHEWTDGDLAYEETCLVTTLTNRLENFQTTNGTEPVVLLAQIRLVNQATEPRQACVWLSWNHTLPWRLAVDGTLVLAAPSTGPDRPGFLPIRGRFNTCGQGVLDMVALPADVNSPPLTNDIQILTAQAALRYRVQLPAQSRHQVELAVPYVELLDTNELAALKALKYETAHVEVTNFWQQRITRGMTYEVPDQFLNEFFKANLWHVLISTDLDSDSGLAQHGAATHHYRNYLNETAMVARSLEMRGEAKAALALLEPFLLSQSRKGLPGNFRGQEGVLYAAYPTDPDPYTAQGYNMHHGWGLWSLAEHYFWTRDQSYLKRCASQLVLGCDWITRERQQTRFLNLDGSRPVEYGLAPAGDLEDVEEYLYYYATDAYYYQGLKSTAEALSAIRHPKARQVQKAAVEFARDLRASVAESVATSPVVQLRDGRYVPYVPSRAYALTHRKEGWIREALYPALHLLSTGVYPVNHPYAHWMIQDLEDNIFLSSESGYGVKNPQASFFDLGGFTLQPNLLDLSLVYLQRDQVANFLRAFYNTAWASLYPDIMCFAEWVPSYGQGAGPLFKTPDECKFIQWMRTMLVMEKGDSLELGLGVPQAWMKDGQRLKIERAATWFGPLNLEIVSQVASGLIQARVQLTPRPMPKTIWLRLRHPEGKPIRSALVNNQPARLDLPRQLIALPTAVSQWEIQARFEE